MTRRNTLGAGVSRSGKQILLNHKPLADAVNEHAAEWIAQALSLQSTRWVEPRPPSRWSKLAAFLAGVVLTAFAWGIAGWIGVLT